ncbi:MAG: DUF3379 family protein [Gammaproteobacteria bacterium]|nr:DUF3379 family protein [Gammaproteobacteria bacterium]
MSEQNQNLDCLEFQRLCLSDPDNQQAAFAEHAHNCTQCMGYLNEVKAMDSSLRDSLDVRTPGDLIARLQLQQEMQQTRGRCGLFKAAALAALLTAGSVLLAGWWQVQHWQTEQQVEQDYQQLLAVVVEHVQGEAFTPVWEFTKANRTANTLLASYDDALQLYPMSNLQFSRICPMGEYRGLHATLQTDHGQITFVYLRGQPLGDLLDTAYQGFITRVKPVRGGNLVLIARDMRALEQGAADLSRAMYWDI